MWFLALRISLNRSVLVFEEMAYQSRLQVINFVTTEGPSMGGHIRYNHAPVISPLAYTVREPVTEYDFAFRP
jgi:hypothetical protein